MKFINQDKIMSELNPLISDIRNNNNNYAVLFQGPAGCGKTTLAKLTVNQSNRRSYGNQIPSNGKINFETFTQHNLHFIDEIHEMKRGFELMYPYIDSGEHTIIFCTTEYGELPEPLLTRCLRFTFEPYELKHLIEIVKRYSYGRNFRLADEESYKMIAEAGRGNPRIAKQRFDRVKMMLQYYDYEPDAHSIRGLLNRIGIYKFGYTKEDLRYIDYLSKIPASSLDNISRALKIDKNTIQKEIEPYLIEKGNIMITSKGRKFLKWAER